MTFEVPSRLGIPQLLRVKLILRILTFDHHIGSDNKVFEAYLGILGLISA